MSLLRVAPLAGALLSMSWLLGCQVFAPSVGSKTLWSVDDPNKTVEVGSYSRPQIARICMDDGFRFTGSVIADRSHTYVVTAGNCIDVEASTFELSVPCLKACASKPLGSGSFEIVRGVASPRGTWILADGGPNDIVHLLKPRFYEFCNAGPQPVRVFSDYHITDRELHEGACGAVRGNDIGVQSDPAGSAASGAYGYVE